MSIPATPPPRDPQYARTIADLMTPSDPQGRPKFLLIGGGINFTDVAKTFTGIVDAARATRI